MNNEKQKEIYLMQATCLANYAKLCIKLNEVPKQELIDLLINCEDLKKLIDSNKIFLEELK